MRTWQRALVALPVAVGFVGLYAATSEYRIQTTNFQATVRLNDEGERSGALIVEVRALSEQDYFGEPPDEVLVGVTVEQEGAPRWFTVNVGDLDAEPARVRDGAWAVAPWPPTCVLGQPCEVPVEVVFYGRPNALHNASFGCGIIDVEMLVPCRWVPDAD
jgi:hypothetical protein